MSCQVFRSCHVARTGSATSILALPSHFLMRFPNPSSAVGESPASHRPPEYHHYYHLKANYRVGPILPQPPPYWPLAEQFCLSFPTFAAAV